MLEKWVKDEGATAAIEAGFLFPVMVGVICGMIDMGAGLITNQKVTDATQMVSDLLTRNPTVSDAEINDAVVAAQLALMPYDVTTLGVDMAGVKFIGTEMTPTVQWRTTVNMSPNPGILANSQGLGGQDEGVVAVTVRYQYMPYFSYYLTGPLDMMEESYARGRKGQFVKKV